MLQLRLRSVKLGRDFRKSERTLLEEWAKEHPDLLADFKRDHCVQFVSQTETIAQFVHNFVELDVQTGRSKLTHRRVIASHKVRIEGGYWNPKMLADYAADAGIVLIGHRKYEEAYKEEQVRRQGLSK